MSTQGERSEPWGIKKEMKNPTNMKRATILFAAILLLAITATAQTPKLSYSAVVRFPSNELVVNQQVTVIIAIRDSQTAVGYVYDETHTVTTNQNGMFSLTIGDGADQHGSLADVDWRTASITTQSILPGDISLVNTIPVTAVPYALYADNFSPEALLGAVSAMTDEQKAALKEALGVTGGGGEPTTFTCGTSKMVDAEGHEYETVQIGSQCWTNTNMRSTKDRNGNLFINGMTAASGSYDGYVDSVVYIPTDAAWSVNNSSVTYDEGTYGYYYNWSAAKLVCPAGWHLPSDAEWTTLTDYVSSQSEFQCEGNSSYIARALASKTTDWKSSSNTCAVGNNPSANNDAGFSAVPAGNCLGSSFDYAGYRAYFWSSTEYSSYFAYLRLLYYNLAGVSRGYYTKAYGRSVRCLRD